MDKKLIKIKQSIFKITITSAILCLISFIIFLLLVLHTFIWWDHTGRIQITIEVACGVFFFIFTFIFSLAWIVGTVFLAKNKKL
ncbi:hypothetical protein SCLARK_00944 [Spiroplasma clarkii]|uniref:hypothetical protein n=1 Tax=Spiroplasma clarkii TaxID=2139 RepID=UPI000B55446C|nr:hypothetical protein [Spiroplasma clarkii]ARU91552.1 hypothetical protein SCLARK_00944 [Spiroplasma clarkii]